MSDYRPSEYWAARLEDEFTLRGVGHHIYSEEYNRWVYRAKARALGRALGPALFGRRALDVGSGTGWVVEQLLSRGAAVEGCDIALVSVQRLQAKYPAMHFAQVELGVEDLPHESAGFDVVTAMDVAYHITDERQWARAVAEMGRVLKPGGLLVVTDRFGARDVPDRPHVRFRSAARWRTAAGAAGLDLDEVRPLYRWLSRDYTQPAFQHLPDAARGRLEFAMERFVPRRPHLQCATLRKHGTADVDP